MTLFFDGNLSPRLVGLLLDLYPGSVHARDVGLIGCSDAEAWRLAGRDGFTIVAKDADFFQRAVLFGPPPKVVWLRIVDTRRESRRACCETTRRSSVPSTVIRPQRCSASRVSCPAAPRRSAA